MGHPVLRTAARSLELSDLRDPSLQTFIDDMIETMTEYRGVGLAAPQVHEGLRLFVALLADDPRGANPDDDDQEPTVIINPEITIVDPDVVEDWEGCLSVPDIRGRVPRAREIVLRGLDRRGSAIEIEAADYPARVIQHETDHLDGVLFFDRMTDFASLTFLEEYARFWRKSED